MSSGMDDIVTKPFTIGVLSAKIKETLAAMKSLSIRENKETV